MPRIRSRNFSVPAMTRCVRERSRAALRATGVVVMPMNFRRHSEPPFGVGDRGAPTLTSLFPGVFWAPNCTPKGYTRFMPRKDVAFKIRIDEELRRAFVEACREQDRPAAQVVREFMRRFVTGEAEYIVPTVQSKVNTRNTKENRKTRG